MDAIGIADRNTLAGVVRMHSACQGRGAEAADRLPARPDRCAEPARLSDRPRRLWPAVAAAQPRQDAGEKGECELTLARRRGACRRASPSSPGRRTISTLSRPSCRGFATPCRHCAMSRRASSIAATMLRGSSGSTGSRKRQRLHDPRDQRRPLSCARPPAAAGRRHLHPRESDDRHRGLSAQPQCRAAFEIAGRDGAAVRALAARDCRDARVRRRAPLQPRRAELRISARDRARGTHAAAASRASDVGGREAALAGRHSRQGADSSSTTSSR